MQIKCQPNFQWQFCYPCWFCCWWKKKCHQTTVSVYQASKISRPTWNYHDTDSDTVFLKYERVKILDSHTYPYTELPPLQKWSTSGVENGNQLGDSTDFFCLLQIQFNVLYCQSCNMVCCNPVENEKKLRGVISSISPPWIDNHTT